MTVWRICTYIELNITSFARETFRTPNVAALCSHIMSSRERLDDWLRNDDKSLASKKLWARNLFVIVYIYLLWFSGIYILYFRKYSRIKCAKLCRAWHVWVRDSVYSECWQNHTKKISEHGIYIHKGFGNPLTRRRLRKPANSPFGSKTC